MNFLKPLKLFMNNHWQYIKRKWLLLPLLLLFPIILISMIAVLLITLFSPSESSPIFIGVVDEDRSEETEMIIDILEESSQFGTYIQIKSLDKVTAKQKIIENDLSTYIVLPENFTIDLYAGRSVNMSVIGNEQQKSESYVVHELVKSLMRHIEAAQANILLTNEYAKKTTMNDADRSDLIMDEFTRSFMSILGKDQIISEQTIENIATSSSNNYFILSSFFMILTMWLLISYHFLYQQTNNRLTERMRLYGVTEIVQICARLLMTLILFILFASIAVIGLYWIGDFSFYTDDLQRIVLLILLYSGTFLMLLSIIEMIISDQRLTLLIHVMLTILFVLLSGAIIPTVYFPLNIQSFLTYIPSVEFVNILQDILLYERMYVDYKPLLIIFVMSTLLLIALSIIKERVQQ